MSINRSDRTFRLTFVRRKIRTAFKSQAVKSALLEELNSKGPDAEVIVKMVERLPTSQPAVVQPVQPTPQTAQLGIFYISQTFQVNRISFMASHSNAVL